jgi:hypothetical protein
MTLPSIEAARGWSGLTAVDSDDESLGRITDIYLDRDTGQPEWALVATPQRRRTFVPLAGAAPGSVTGSPWPCPRRRWATHRRSGRAGNCPTATRRGCTGTTSVPLAMVTGAPVGRGAGGRRPGGRGGCGGCCWPG